MLSEVWEQEELPPPCIGHFSIGHGCETVVMRDTTEKVGGWLFIVMNHCPRHYGRAEIILSSTNIYDKIEKGDPEEARIARIVLEAAEREHTEQLRYRYMKNPGEGTFRTTIRGAAWYDSLLLGYRSRKRSEETPGQRGLTPA